MEKVYPSSQLDQFLLRFPDGMRERIKSEAALNGRSMNSEIVFQLNKIYPREEQS